MTPTRLNPKEDYQVKQALISLKSFDVYKKNAGSEPPKFEPHSQEEAKK